MANGEFVRDTSSFRRFRKMLVAMDKQIRVDVEAEVDHAICLIAIIGFKIPEATMSLHQVVNLKALFEVRDLSWDTASVIFDQCQQREPFKIYRAWRNCEQCRSKRRVESPRKRTNRCRGVSLQQH
ncbi:unnamed protein product, partial [Mesorhabditis belari]|uniref:Uncharacterized protein n=1 Tax=Mesorhabditis belari TaxID=2138241 RepID=A0AAF3EMZ0_9BILA